MLYKTLLILEGNSLKNHNNQPVVAHDIADQLRVGERGIVGVMIESNLHAGKQDVPPEGPGMLQRGVSITDACIDWDTTITVLEGLAEAVRARRVAVASEKAKQANKHHWTVIHALEEECRVALPAKSTVIV